MRILVVEGAERLGEAATCGCFTGIGSMSRNSSTYQDTWPTWQAREKSPEGRDTSVLRT